MSSYSYDWQDYDEPVTNTVRDFPLAASDYERKQWFGDDTERPLGRNERAQKSAQDFLFDYAKDMMSGGRSYQTSAQSAASRRRESSSPYGTKQVFDNFAIYTPAPLQVGGGTSSSGGKSGMFGEIGGLAGTLGLAAGVFGPLGPAVGAGVGKVIDMFA